MIKKIVLKNYRTHEDTELDLDEGINAFVGASQKGKTNVHRAIRWVAKNDPPGSRFKSDFAGKKDETEVSIFVTTPDPNHPVAEVTKTSKEYRLSNYANPFVGKKVPDEVQETLNLSEINFQSQHEKPYLVAAKPAEVGREINRITRMDKADAYLSKIHSRLIGTRAEEASIKKDLEEKKEKLLGFADIEALEKKLNYLTKKEEELQGIITTIYSAQLALGKMVEIQESLDRCQHYLMIESDLVAAEEIMSEIHNLDKVITAIITIKEKRKNRTAHETVSKSVEPVLADLIAKADEVNSLNVKINASQRSIKTAKSLSVRSTTALQEKEQYLTALINLIRDHNKCPFCFGPITEDCIDRIKEEYK